MNWLISILRDNVWNGIAGLAAILTILYAAVRFITKRKPWHRFIRWILDRWRYVLLVIAIASGSYLAFSFTNSVWSILFTVTIALVTYLLTTSRYFPYPPRTDQVAVWGIDKKSAAGPEVRKPDSYSLESVPE